MQYNWDSESIQINSITVFKSGKSAKMFMEQIYPYWSDSIVVSDDGEYPTDPKLKELVLEKLKTDVNCPVIIFANYLENLQIASTRTLGMQYFLEYDFYRFDSSERIFYWDERKIATFLDCWIKQCQGNIRPNQADMRQLFHPDSVAWYHSLVFE